MGGKRFFILSVFLPIIVFIGTAAVGGLKRPGTAPGFTMVVQQGHSDWVSALAFSPDGSYFASASKDATVKIWSMDGILYRSLPHNSLVFDIAISPDGKYLASACPEEVLVWRVVDGVRVARFSSHSYAQVVSFSVDGKKVVSGWKNRFLRVYDIEKKALAWEVEAHTSGISALAVSPDGTLIATGSFCRDVHDVRDTTVKVWDIGNGKPVDILRGHKGDVVDIAFSLDGKRLASCGSLGEIMLWNAKDRSLIKSFAGSPARANMKKIALSVDGTYLAATGMEKENVRIWSLPEARPCASFQAQIAGNNDIAFTADSRFLVTASDDHCIRFWDVSSWKNVKTIGGSSGKVSSVGITPDGKHIIAGTLGGKSAVKVWSLQDGSLRSTVKGDNIVAVSPDGRHFATAFDSGLGFSFDRTYNNPISIFSHEGKLVKELEGAVNDINSLSFSPDGKLIASAGHMEIRVWDIQAGRMSYHFKGLGGARRINVEDVCFSPDGNSVVVIDENGISLRNVRNGKSGEGYYCREEINGIALSRFHLVAAVGNEVRVWKRGGEAFRALKGHSMAVLAIAISPDGKYLASAGYDQTIILWRLADYSRQREYRGHQDLIQALTFTPDGRHIVSGSNDSTVRVWKVGDDSSMALLSSQDMECVMYTEDGLFDSSRNGGSAVSMVSGLRAWAVDQFAIHNNRPDIILERLGLGTRDGLDTYYSHYLKRMKKAGAPEGGHISNAIHAPSAKIITAATDGKTCRIGFALSDALFDLKSFNIHVNDVPLYGAYGKRVTGKSATLAETVELTGGKNKIEVSCTNENGVESYRALAYAEYNAPTKGDLYYLGFGVSKYRDASLDLKYADKDAKDLADMYSAMKGTYNNVIVKTYLNEEVTIENIRKSKEMLKNARVDDTFVLFIAGHGVHDTGKEATYYYLTHNADRNNLSGTCANFELVEELLQGIAPRNKLFLMDTCESGEIDDTVRESYYAAAGARGLRARTARALVVTGKTAPAKRPYLYQKDRYIYNDLIRRSGAIVFSSSKGGEFSYESEAIQNGYFTKEIIAAIKTGAGDRNRDGIVSTDELRDFVAERVAKETGDLQHPTVDRDNLYQKFGFPAR